MSKRVFLNDDELYIIKQLLQDIDNQDLFKNEWVYKYIGSKFIAKLMKKLSNET